MYRAYVFYILLIIHRSARCSICVGIFVHDGTWFATFFHPIRINSYVRCGKDRCSASFRQPDCTKCLFSKQFVDYRRLPLRMEGGTIVGFMCNGITAWAGYERREASDARSRGSDKLITLRKGTAYEPALLPHSTWPENLAYRTNPQGDQYGDY